MKRFYQAPEVEMIYFESEGVVATSQDIDPNAPENWGWGEEHEI